MTPLSTSHVFISYSRKNTEVMQRIVLHLRRNGINAWVDNEKLVPGTPIWEREIEKAIRSASAVVVVLSPDAKDSVWVLNELTLADEYKKRVFPVLVGGDFKDSVPFRLVTRQFVDLRINESSSLDSLSTAISSHLDELTQLEKEHQQIEPETAGQEKEKTALPKLEAEQIGKFKPESERLVEERPLANETKMIKWAKILTSWRWRMLLGAVLVDMIIGIPMILLIWNDFWSTIIYDFPKIIAAVFGISLIGGLTGLILYPHKISILCLLIAALVVDRIYYVTTVKFSNDPPLELLAGYLFFGLIFGGLPGALLSRILHWLKIIE